MPQNPIYQFLKDNNLTTKDEQSFNQEYSDPNKAQQLYQFFQQNNLTTKDSASFYNTYFKPNGFDSKEVQQQQAPEAAPNQFTNAQAPTGQITNQQTLTAQQHQPTSTEQKQIGEYGSKIQKQQEDKIRTAAENTIKRLYGENPPSDKNKTVDDLIWGYGNGSLGIVKDAQGNDVLKNTGNFFQSFKAAADQAHAQDIENKYLQSISKNEAISYLNRIADKPETGIVKEMDIAPSGLGEALGQQSQILGKATIGSLAGAETGLTGGASAGSFAAIAKDLATSGYSQALKKNYYELKKEGLNDSDAFDKATHAALTGEVVSLGQGALLSGEIPLTPKAAAGETLLGKLQPNQEAYQAQQGFVNSLKHTAKSAPKVVGSAMVGSVINDIQENAIANGNPIDAKQMIKNSVDAGESMATIHGALGLLTAVANGQKTIAPSYIRPQAENVISGLPRADVAQYLNGKELNGDIPQGTTQKVLGALSAFDKQKAIVAPFRISEENKAAIAGKLVQKQKLLDELSTLKPNENAFPERIAEINKNITGIDGEINKLYNAKNVFEKETDTNTGDKTFESKTFEELKPQQKEGIKVESDYGKAEVEEKGEGENKTFIPKAYYNEPQGSFIIKKNIPVEGTFTDKDKAQQAADNALKQHYYENGLHDNAKPDKKIETQKETEVIEPKGNVGSNANNEPIATEETKSEPTNVAEISQEPTEENSVTVIKPEENIQPNIISPINTEQNEKANEPIPSNEKMGEQQTGQGNGQKVRGEQPERQGNGQENGNENVNQEKIGGQNATTKSAEQQQEGGKQTGISEHQGVGTSRIETQTNESNNRNSGINSEGAQQEKVNQGGEPPKEGELPLTEIHTEHPKTILTHRGLQEIATEIGAEDITPRQRESRLAQLKEADDLISQWKKDGTYDKNIKDVIDRASKGKIDEVEQKILANHIATLREERRNITDQNSKEFKDKTTELAATIKAGATMRSKAGGLLGDKAFGQSVPNDYSSPESVQKSVEFVTNEPINKAQEQKIKELTNENARLKQQAADAEKKAIAATDEELNKPKSTKTRTTATAKKSHEQYVKERKSAFDDARAALKKLRTGESGLGVSIPLARELAAVAPHIAKVVKSLIEEGVDKLGDIVDTIHDELSKDMDGLRRRDVMDLIAGDYNKTEDKAPELNKYADIKKQSKLVKKLEDLQNGLPENFDSNKTEQTPEVKKLLQQIKKVKEDLAAIGYMKKKDTFIPLTAEEKNIKNLTKELEDAKNGIFKQKNEKRPLSEIEKDLQEQIQEERQKAGLVSSKAEKPLTEQEQKEADQKELEDLQKQFADKKSNDKQFTPEQATDLWNYGKKNYLDKGVDLFDTVKQVSLDTGLTYEQVAAAFRTPKTKPITDAAWLKQYQLRTSNAKIDNYIEQQNRNPVSKVWHTITRIPKAITTAIHGHIFPGTHYPMGFLTPQDWGLYFKSYAVSAKNAYGSDAFHEQEIRRITGNKNYAIARRAGLANDVSRTDTDDFENAPKIFGRIGKTGTKGFLGMKDLRQNMFDRYWDALPKDEQTPEAAESIAYLMNSATLASNVKIPAFMKEGLFSAGMESSRWGKIFKNPVKATTAALRVANDLLHGNTPKPEDKVFAKIWGQRVGQQLATMAGALWLNAYIQSKINPKNPVNLTDPTKSDWLKMKADNTDIDLSGGVLGIKNFLIPVAQYAIKDKNYKQELGDIGGKGLQYGRNKLSPFYGDAADIALGTDWAGNPLPYSNQKPTTGKHKLNWAEYLSEKAPIFASDALQSMTTSAEDNGLPKSQTDKIVNGIISTGLTGGLGVHNTPSYQKPTPYTEEDYKKPAFKWVKDKGLELPNTSLSSEEVPHTGNKISDYPQPIQEKYQSEHKKQLEQSINKIRQQKYVYVNTTKNLKGVITNEVATEPQDSKSKRTSLDKLDKNELTQVLSIAQKEATTNAKKKIFNK